MPGEPEGFYDAVGRDTGNVARTSDAVLRRQVVYGRGTHVAILLLALCGMMLVLLCTWPYGPGTSPDSVNYLSAARSLLAGQGYRYPDGGVFTHWPPLYPTLLAALEFVGIDALRGAAWANSLAFGLTILLSGWLLVRCAVSPAFVVIGVLAVVLSGPLLDAFVMVYSEPVFVLLTLVFLLSMTTYLRVKSAKALLLAALAAGLACLQRYVGATLVLTGCLLIGLGPSRIPLRRRCRDLVCFCLIAVGPIAVWFLRNYIHTGGIAGPREFYSSAGQGIDRALVAGMNVLSEWFVPGSGSLQTKDVFHFHTTQFVKWFGAGSLSSPVRVVGMAIVVLVAAIAVLRSRRTRGGSNPGVLTAIGPAAVFVLTYFGFLTVYSMRVSWDPFTGRHLTPIFIPIVLLLVAGMEETFGLLGRLVGRSAGGKALGLAVCILWLAYPLDIARTHVCHCHAQGPGGYSTPQWKNSPTMEWLRNHPLPGRVYSNGPDAVYLMTGVPASLSPRYPWVLAEIGRREFASQPTYVVWLDNVYWSLLYLYDLPELLSSYRMEEVAAFADGRIYRYLGERGPGISGVYRFWSTRLGSHFYTIQKAERDRLITQGEAVWSYEGVSFYAFAPDGPRPEGVLPVYRFWSAALGAHFYTIDETERDRLACDRSGVWTCEGIAFYAWPRSGEEGGVPVYRFWSERLGHHFYTADEGEKARILNEFSETWTYENIAWYAYRP